MWYYGKTEDSFSDALNIMLTNSGCDPVPHLDCISKRAFGCFCWGGPETWFIPLVTCPEAVKHLNGFLSGPKLLQFAVGQTMSAEEALQRAKSGCVVGPLKHSASIWHLKYSMYQGERRFIYIGGEDGGLLRACDPSGVPVWYLGQQEYLDIIKRENAYIIWTDYTPNRVQETPGWIEVLKSGLSFHNEISSREDSVARFDFTAHYKKCSTGHIALQLGLSYYIIEIAKVLDLAGEIRMLEDCQTQRIRHVLNEINEIKNTQNVETIPILDRKLWDMIYELYDAI